MPNPASQSIIFSAKRVLSNSPSAGMFRISICSPIQPPGTPTDLWIPSSNIVKPELADQISLGYYRNFNDNRYEFSAETYFKNLMNQIDYKNGAELMFNENVESQILFGNGRAYGLGFS